MPQTPTPNMGLIKPTENGDDDVWDLLLDAQADLIDQHDHSGGKGVKVPLATGATVTADVPWASGGNFFAITGLKAIDFQPLPTSAMTAYAGALFVDSATNELNWRTTGGANVRITNGTTLNVSLTGTIGGDYASVGALIDFTDTTDTYALRQQIGTGVRQFARLQTGDVDFYEFKAQPAAGVPANRVRLKSPTSLAASYDATLPAALPAAAAFLQMSASGVISASDSHGTRTMIFHGTAFQEIANSSALRSTGNGFALQTPTLQAILSIPVLRVGVRFLAIRVFIQDTAGATIFADFTPYDATGAGVTIASSATSTGAGTSQTLTMTGLTTVTAASNGYSIRAVANLSGATNFVRFCEVDYDLP